MVGTTATGSPHRKVGTTATGSPKSKVGTTATGSPSRMVEATATVSPKRKVETTATGSPIRKVETTATGLRHRMVEATAACSLQRMVETTATGVHNRRVETMANGLPIRTVETAATGSLQRMVKTTATGSPSRTVKTTATCSPNRKVETTATGSPNMVETTAISSPSRMVETMATGSLQRTAETTATCSPSRIIETTATCSPPMMVETTATGSSNRIAETTVTGSPRRKRIAIIGAGCSGLTAIKCCLDEGLEPVCFEKSDDIGGLWRYSDAREEGRPSIYRSLVINTSKDMMMFSDFPPPEEFPPFLTHSLVLTYFGMYAKHFGLLRHIRFNVEVRLVRKSQDYKVSGRWTVETACTRTTSAADVEEFDGVMICSGHHSYPYTPMIQGLGSFRGHVIHSHAYKEPGAFQGKRVVILGLGNSASDIACDLAKTTEQVYLSSRRGAWIVPRTAFWGLPADMLANSRVVFTLPMKLLDWCVQKQANFRIDHDTYGLRPQHGVLNCHPTINDELPIHLVSGRVKTKTRIARVESGGVWFEGDPTFCPCDAIILATGYDYRVSFLHEDAFQIVNNRTTLYKYMFPPHLPHPTLAAIGLVQAIGAVMPIAEVQSRWFTSLIAGKTKLPSRQVMEEDIQKKRDLMNRNYVSSRRHTMQTFWIDYMDQVSSEIGARPNLWKMLLRDPELALKCYLGPCLPSQYRLYGPGKWSGARQFIISAYLRANKPKGDCRAAVSKNKRRSVCVNSAVSSSDVLTLDQGHQQRSAAGWLYRKDDDHGQRRPRFLSPDWATLLFYVVIMLACGFVWFMGGLLDKTGVLINSLDGKLDHRLPITE